MLGIDRRAARITWTVLLVLLLFVVVPFIWHPLMIFVIAVLLAYLLSPLVNFMDRLLPGRRTRTAALAIVYLLLVAAAVVSAMVVGSRVVEQASALALRVPDLLANMDHPDPRLPQAVQQALPAIKQQIIAHAKDMVALMPQAGMRILSAASNVIYLVLVPILAFFFLKDGRQLLAAMVDSLSEYVERSLLQDIVEDVHLLLAQYMRALVILAAATFVFYSSYFAIIGTPYAILLAAVAAPLEFIPVVGPLVASIAIIAVDALSGSPHVLAILIFLGVYRLFQDYVLSPHLMSQGMELHPLTVLFGVFAGGQIAGVMGTFLSVPAMAILRIVYRRLRKSRREAELAPLP